MKKKKHKRKLEDEFYILKAGNDGFVISSISSFRKYTESKRREWSGFNAKVVRVKVIEQ